MTETSVGVDDFVGDNAINISPRPGGNCDLVVSPDILQIGETATFPGWPGSGVEGKWHPGSKLDVEGFTDSVGTDDYSQKLSEQRSCSVRDYLSQNGIAGNLVTAKGFGKSQPVASNDTAAGGQKNRRVELLVSGGIIGVQIGTPIALR
jgi:hypothetical protein